MRVLVTGATSGLGRNAIDYLCAKGIDVRATGSNPAIKQLLEKTGAEFIQADLGSLVSTQAKTMLAGVDTLWYCSGSTSPWGTRTSFNLENVKATKRLGEWAVAFGVKHFVYISSPSVYFDFKHHLNINESYRPVRFANHLAESKVEGEAVIQGLAEANPQTRFTILRPLNLFGTHDTIFMPRLVTMMRRYGSVLLPRSGAAMTDMTCFENAVHAMWLATQSQSHRSGNAYNIANNQPSSVRNVVEMLTNELNIPCKISILPYPIFDIIARGMEHFSHKREKEPAFTHYGVGKLNFDFTLDTALAEKELGYQPIVSLEDGIHRTASWLKTHGTLCRN